jgi:hypothetical protein
MAATFSRPMGRAVRMRDVPVVLGGLTLRRAVPTLERRPTPDPRPTLPSKRNAYRYCPVATRSIERPPLVSSPCDVIVRM